MYGLTEAFRSTYLAPEDLLAHPLMAQKQVIGKAIPGAQLYVVNRGLQRECEAHETGELVHAGDLVSLGYWQNKQATDQVFVPMNQVLENCTSVEKLVCSGDEVYRDELGYLYFVKRNNDMIKSSGYRISPNEIESVFLQQPLIHQAVVTAVDDELLGQAIVVFCVLDDHTKPDKLTEKKILQPIKKNLPNYMQPKAVIFKSSLPVTANGKIDKQQLKQDYLASLTA